MFRYGFPVEISKLDSLRCNIHSLTSDDLSPHVKRRCVEFAGFESHPRYSYKLVDVYTHLGTFWKDDSRGTLPHVTTFKD